MKKSVKKQMRLSVYWSKYFSIKEPEIQIVDLINYVFRHFPSETLIELKVEFKQVFCCPCPEEKNKKSFRKNGLIEKENILQFFLVFEIAVSWNSG